MSTLGMFSLSFLAYNIMSIVGLRDCSKSNFLLLIGIDCIQVTTLFLHNVRAKKKYFLGLPININIFHIMN